MSKYQKINDWCILSAEKDKTMLEHANADPIDQCCWSENFVKEDLMVHYFKQSTRRTVIDVGASYGWMAVSLAKYFKDVKCFEIREDVRYALRQNVSTFSNVEVFDCGLSDKEKQVKFLNTRSTGHTRVLEDWVDKFKPGKGKDTAVSPLDSFNFKDVDCIKLDVEHYEFNVLLGAEETIKKWKPLLIVETTIKKSTGSYNERQRVFKLLRKFDYEIKDTRSRDIIFTHKSLNHCNDVDL